MRNGDRWIKCISTTGNVRAVAIQARDLVQNLGDLHQLAPDGIQKLGEAIIGALMVASYCKPGERINFNLRGSGSFSRAFIDAYPDGSVRGYLDPSCCDTSKASVASLETGPWGRGVLAVLRTKDEEGMQPYIGNVPLITGHLAKDLSFYWLQSEQIPSSVGIAVKIDDNRVNVAGGFLVQAMPGASAAEITSIEKNINQIQTLVEKLSLDSDPVQLLSQIFQHTSFMLIDEKPLISNCKCSYSRVERALVLTGENELRSMLHDDGQVVVTCDFCRKEYKLDSLALGKLLKSNAES
ncbi:MAG: hypothetical protein A3K03_12530 [Bdellovibrionales bacterium RIFOXYD1_FULL_44_7]|nr:MAG: hypothetical protein A3K03_12530 [Bdellovibrionales bacterium RIFOXYD1_FULL_44_7]